jgi:hypothetical protein
MSGVGLPGPFALRKIAGTTLRSPTLRRGLHGDQHQDILTFVDPVILASARRHGISDEDMLHAYRNPIRVFEFDELTIVIGPDQAARLLEVGIAPAEGIEFVVHAMFARDKFLE